ncbi:SusC/RagA family TonB-linked outer membrane protein [Pseudozobellia thermophila]|uniref:TonB-linked outer membrane protein, SusC/RagA family n=1 Tax=Pseudozobellia thermophila TaxID=192903 RepID=A0A1M6GGU8_9FLAO|nr:TonB-dependent receptor [Pseudozobellia thermophila]SHJ09159.1 TonB-linked outer membrane protein, SusC/RagA family [Pseudozobellia thermophila]
MKKKNVKQTLLKVFWGMFFGMLLCTVQAYAQEQTVVGTVADEQGPIPGANILVKGTSRGVTTDFDGNFSIQASPDDVLVVSYIGYATQNITVGNRTSIDIRLQADQQQLEEVVVIGYGTRRKGSLTSAVATVDNNYLEQQPVSNVSKALQGSASGVTTISASTPGGDAEVRIRGMGTINNNGPLWVVDGVQGAPSPPPGQIESIQVLKDASSTAIYGARGANGVILVTTKSGRKNQAVQIDMSVKTGMSFSTAKYDIMTDPQLLGELMWLELGNDGLPQAHTHYGNGAVPVLNEYLFPNGGVSGSANVNMALYDQQSYPITKANAQGTDWLDEIYQHGLLQDYNLSVTGGSEKTSYSFQGGFLEENGILKNTSFNRISFRSNVDSRPLEWLNIGQRLGVTYGETKGWGGNNSHNNLFNQIYLASPLIPVRDEAGNWAGGVVGGSIYDGPNPVGYLDRLKNNYNKKYNITGNIYAAVEPIGNLTIKTLLGYDVQLLNGFSPTFAAWEQTNGARGTTLYENSSNASRWNWTNTVNYKKTFAEDHNLDVLVGIEASKQTYRYMSASRQDYFSDDLNFLVLDAGASNQLNNGSGYASSLFSFFSRLNYDYAQKYMVDLTVRRDGSSRFGESNRYGVFPAASVGWVVSKENFLSGAEDWLSYFKLRASWGQSGNDQIGNYNSYTTFGSNPGASFYAISGSDNNITLGYESLNLGNPDAKWETTTSTNIAFDATFFRKFDLSVDFWKKDTEDMLFPVAIPQVAGDVVEPSVNIGSMSNKGVDISLSYRTSAWDDWFKLNVSGTFTAYKNEVTKLSNNENEFLQGFPTRQQIYTRTEAGHSFPEYYGYVVDGIFQTQAEADAHAVNGDYNQPGNLIIRDVDGDGEITPDDRTYIGNPHPDFTTGLRLGMEFGNVDFSATLYASVGNDLANYTNRFIRYGLFTGPNSEDRLYRSWGSPYLADNNDAILPKASTSTSFEQNASTEYIEDGSFLRVQNLQLGYTFPEKLVEDLHIKHLKLYVQGANLFTFTKYSGLDPEITAKRENGVAQEIDRGVDVGTWPIAKQIMLGLNISL